MPTVPTSRAQRVPRWRCTRAVRNTRNSIIVVFIVLIVFFHAKFTLLILLLLYRTRPFNKIKKVNQAYPPPQLPVSSSSSSAVVLSCPWWRTRERPKSYRQNPLTNKPTAVLLTVVPTLTSYRQNVCCDNNNCHSIYYC